MKSKIIAIKQIHGIWDTASSKDKYVYKYIKQEDIKDLRNINSNYQDNKVNLFYLESDESLSHGLGFGIDVKPEDMTRKIAEYIKMGFKEGYPKEASLYWKRQGKIEMEKRKKDGFILWMSKPSKKDYLGGFSTLITGSKEFKSYAKYPCHGYIGHSVRKVKLDSFIEKEFMKLNPPSNPYFVTHTKENILACWLTSTSARHFGDGLKGLSFKEQKEKVIGNLKSMYNDGFVYLMPEQEGTLASSIKVADKYKKYLFV